MKKLFNIVILILAAALIGACGSSIRDNESNDYINIENIEVSIQKANLGDTEIGGSMIADIRTISVSSLETEIGGSAIAFPETIPFVAHDSLDTEIGGSSISVISEIDTEIGGSMYSDAMKINSAKETEIGGSAVFIITIKGLTKSIPSNEDLLISFVDKKFLTTSDDNGEFQFFLATDKNEGAFSLGLMDLDSGNISQEVAITF